MINESRAALLRQRLGKAAKLVDNDQFLPMFRNRQINHADIFEYSVKLAKEKRKPAAYFAKIWAKKNLEKTISWLKQSMARARARLAEMKHAMKERARLDDEAAHYNADGRARLAEMKREFKLTS